MRIRNTFLIVAGVIVLFALINQCTGDTDKEFRDKIKKLNYQIDSLKNDTKLKEILISNLNDTIDYKEILLIDLKNKTTLVKTKRDEIKNIINNLAVTSIDSTLSNYRHPVRE